MKFVELTLHYTLHYLLYSLISMIIEVLASYLDATWISAFNFECDGDRVIARDFEISYVERVWE